MIDHQGFYMIRRPVKSIDQLFHIHQQLTVRPLEVLLKEYYGQDLLAREAIMVASPFLSERLVQWLNGEPVSEKKQLLATLYKYLVRSTSRCTPFGLFACCSTGKIGKTNQIGLTSDEIEKHVSLDAEVLAGLSRRLLEIPEICAQLHFYPNTTLYDTGSKYHYVELISNNNQSKYFISALEKSDALSMVIEACQSGAVLKDLVLLLVSNGNEPDDALRFLELLIENQIIITDINPTVSGAGYLQYLTGMLKNLNETRDLLDSLKTIQSDLCKPNSLLAKNEELRSDLETSGFKVNKPSLMKVDAFFASENNQLSDLLINDISKSVNELMVLNQNKVPFDLLAFKKRLNDHYGGEEVSLAEALDEDIGIGYGVNSGATCSAMIEELELDPTEPVAGQPEIWWQQFLADKYFKSVENAQNEVELTNEDLEFISKNRAAQSPVRKAASYFVFGNLIAGSANDLDKGDFKFNLLACQGPSAVNMMSRFADGMPALTQKLKSCAKAEQRLHPDVVFAEIIHHPENKAGNIVNRPVLYDYEIQYLGQASVSGAFRMRLDDLMVSVRSNEIILRSKRLNKRIIPRLSSMHNHRKGLPAYRFLCDLQEQDANLNLVWDWGFLAKQAHLPRIRYKKIIVSRESWLLQTACKGDLQSLQAMLLRLKTPQRFVIVSGDNELLIDTSVNDSMQLLADICSKNETVRLMEFLGEPENCLVKKGSESYVSELVIPFLDVNTAPIPGYSLPTAESTPNRYLLGDEWLYIKLYTHEKSSESPLISLLYQCVSKMLAAGTISSFFFVRYQDPEPHLRLRFKGDPASKFYIQVIQELREVLSEYIQSGTISNIQTDTYQREINRYGQQNIEIIERLFHLDSMDTMQFLADRSCDERERFLLAVKKADVILSRAGMSLNQKHGLMEKLRESFFNEFKGDTTLRKRLNVRFQQSKMEIHQTLLLTEFDAMTEQGTLLGELTAGDNSGNASRNALLSSLIHMAVNRIFVSQQRTYELILYHCLFKYYDAQIATSKPAVCRNISVESH
jgi:thiopeptide-type bacteriocin biosynthesis protein